MSDLLALMPWSIARAAKNRIRPRARVRRAAHPQGPANSRWCWRDNGRQLHLEIVRLCRQLRKVRRRSALLRWVVWVGQAKRRAGVQVHLELAL